MLCYQSKVEDKKFLPKAYVGRVCVPKVAFNLQTYFDMEGVFGIRVTQMGPIFVYLRNQTTTSSKN